MIEPIEFSVFGVRVKEEDLINIKSAMGETYNYLMSEDTRWEDPEFCKREIVSLWDGIVDMLSRLSRELPDTIEPTKVRNLLIIDRDNEEFLSLFGEVLKRRGALDRILKQLKEINIKKGSLRIFFKDSLTQKTIEVKIELDKIMSQIRKESSKIKSGLKHFVSWIRKKIRPSITCSMVTGIIILSLIALCYVGVTIIGTKLFIMTVLAIICAIYDIYGTYTTITEVKKALSRRIGLHMVNI